MPSKIQKENFLVDLNENEKVAKRKKKEIKKSVKFLIFFIESLRKKKKYNSK